MRFPRFHRFEYIFDLLESIELGLNDVSKIDEKLKKRKKEFEHMKYIATGRGRQNSNSDSSVPSALTRDGISSCLKMGLILSDPNKKGYKLTEEGKHLLATAGSNKEFDHKFSLKCLEHYFKAYPDSLLMLTKLRSLPKMELDIPDTRNTGHATAEEISNIIGFRIDSPSLKSLVYTLGQNQLVNFQLIKIDTNNSIIRTYLTCKICEKQCSNKSSMELAGDQLVSSENIFIINDIDQEDFEDITWKEYLRITKNYEDIPVYYWDLRSAVCYRLRISDQVFDRHLLELAKSSTKLRMGWSSGYVPSTVANANAMKSLPPKIDDKYYIVYVSFDRRQV